MDASRLGFDPLIPWVALWVLAGGAVVLWGVYVVYRGKAWLFRALALTVLALALANPLWIEEQREPLKDIVAVVMDRSESMNFRGRTETAQAAYDALRREIEADENARTAHRRDRPRRRRHRHVYRAAVRPVGRAARSHRRRGDDHRRPDPRHPGRHARTPSSSAPSTRMIVGGDDEIDRNIEIQSGPVLLHHRPARRDARAGQRSHAADRRRSASPSMARRSPARPCRSASRR